MRKISEILLNNKQILLAKETSYFGHIKVDILFDSKDSFYLWHALINDRKVFDQKKLNDMGFKVRYITQV